ncbi:hypothetical protein ACO2E3_06015 [Staphylococcus epidermidis]
MISYQVTTLVPLFFKFLNRKKVWIVHPHSMTNYSLILFLNNPNKPKPASNIIKAGF